MLLVLGYDFSSHKPMIHFLDKDDNDVVINLQEILSIYSSHLKEEARYRNQQTRHKTPRVI